jgi:hypothetical protein
MNDEFSTNLCIGAMGPLIPPIPPPMANAKVGRTTRAARADAAVRNKKFRFVFFGLQFTRLCSRFDRKDHHRWMGLRAFVEGDVVVVVVK